MGSVALSVLNYCFSAFQGRRPRFARTHPLATIYRAVGAYSRGAVATLRLFEWDSSELRIEPLI